MTTGGKREGAGRKPGSIGRKSLEAIGILNGMGCEPLELLANVAMGKPFKDGQVPTTDQQVGAAKELVQYKYPKLKAMEHSGSIGSHEETLEELAAEDDE